jgi:hypothetical protein
MSDIAGIGMGFNGVAKEGSSSDGCFSFPPIYGKQI